MKKLPHFVLLSGTRERSDEIGRQGGHWQFRLEEKSNDGTTSSFQPLVVTDYEPDVSQERLELLAVVRGLEALDQPSSVTLLTSSRQVCRAVRQGLDYWRQRDWKWERFGEKVPMKNSDLWQRIDQALQIHEVRCRHYRIDEPARNAVPRPAMRRRGERLRKEKAVKDSWRPTRPLTSAVRGFAKILEGTAAAVRQFLPEADGTVFHCEPQTMNLR